MATYDEVIQALRNADAQGNVEDARRLAQIAQSIRQQSATTEQPQTPVAQQPAQQRNKFAELISPTYSLLRGAVIQPALGVNELLARTGLFGQAVKQGAIRNVQQEQLASETLKKAAGREGFDVPELAGAVFSPINKLFPTAGVSKLMAGGIVQGGIMPSGASEESYL